MVGALLRACPQPGASCTASELRIRVLSTSICDVQDFRATIATESSKRVRRSPLLNDCTWRNAKVVSRYEH